MNGNVLSATHEKAEMDTDLWSVTVCSHKHCYVWQTVCCKGNFHMLIML